MNIIKKIFRKHTKSKKSGHPKKVNIFPGNFIHETAVISNPGYIKMGNNCWIGGFSCLYANPPGIVIGNNVIFANNVTVINNFHNY